jgi:hypothetical protein
MKPAPVLIKHLSWTCTKRLTSVPVPPARTITAHSEVMGTIKNGQRIFGSMLSRHQITKRTGCQSRSALNRMDELFAVDAEARRRVSGLTGRHALRQERAMPLLDDILRKIEAAQSVALPSSALSKACHYALTLWKKLTRFLEYPELELSNNLAT